jgi:CorA-like Mg2+ transporter protein
MLSTLVLVHKDFLLDAFIHQRQKLEVLRALDSRMMDIIDDSDLFGAENQGGQNVDAARDATRVLLLLHAVSLANAGAIEGSSRDRRHALDAAMLLAHSFSGGSMMNAIQNPLVNPQFDFQSNQKVSTKQRRNICNTCACCTCKCRSANGKLASRAELKAAPPELALEQFSVLVISPRLVLTMRPRIGTKYSDSVIGILLEGLITRLRVDAAARVRLHPSVNALALDIVDAILQFNSGVRDDLRGWASLVESDILESASSEHGLHLFALRKVCDAYIRQSEPIRRTLAREHDAQRGNVGMGGITGGGGLTYRARKAATAALTATTLNSPKPFSSEQPMIGTAVAMSEIEEEEEFRATLTLGEFFDTERATLADLGEELDAQLADVEALAVDCVNLSNMRRALQDETQNRTLFLLTVVTVSSLPASLLSSFWGMNFDSGLGLYVSFNSN